MLCVHTLSRSCRTVKSSRLVQKLKFLFVPLHELLSSALEQITDRGFHLCHACLRWRNLWDVDTPHGRLFEAAAFLARPTTVDGHFGLRVIYGSGLLDCKRYSFNRPAVLENTRLAPRTPVRQIRSHGYTPEHSHLWQRRLLFFHRLFSKQGVGFLPSIHDRSTSRGGSALSVLRDSDLPRPTGGFR